MTLDCPGCETEFELDKFPFGDNVRCPTCKRVWETDWDYGSDYDIVGPWISGEAK
jgi:predicted Zn finger-like uncharacterized protein